MDGLAYSFFPHYGNDLKYHAAYPTVSSLTSAQIFELMISSEHFEAMNKENKLRSAMHRLNVALEMLLAILVPS